MHTPFFLPEPPLRKQILHSRSRITALSLRQNPHGNRHVQQPALPSPFPSTPRALSSLRNSVSSRVQMCSIFHNDLQRQMQQKGEKISFIIICQLKKLFQFGWLLLETARGHGLSSNKHGRQAGSRWYIFTVTRRDSLLFLEVSGPQNNKTS